VRGVLLLTCALADRGPVMRADGSLRLLLNTALFDGMACEVVQGRSVRVVALDGSSRAVYLFRVRMWRWRAPATTEPWSDAAMVPVHAINTYTYMQTLHILSHAHTYTHIRTYTHTHTHTLSLSLSVSTIGRRERRPMRWRWCAK
jgi:hypothetical protein